MHFLMFAAECGRAEALGKYQVRWNVGGPKVKTTVVRNQACQFATLGNATHLLFIDDDMLITVPDLIEKLLEADKPIISPIFFRSGMSPDPLVFKIGSDGEPEPMVYYPVDQVFQAPGGTGTGVMLIKTEVLRAMRGDEDPWFRIPPHSTRGMDVDFCMRAAEHGFASYCDSRLLVEQMGLPQPTGRSQWEDRQKAAAAQRAAKERANG